MFAEMPLDNLNGRQFTAVAASWRFPDRVTGDETI